ncbi:sigma factor regulator [Mobilisporobacter senegalensis]|uniref:Sigma factor regulator n=1 Tax=Mobilisporobacter senegalensis TaxID=1329262 RepID=A0A3N1XRE2_9FIRM|nr:sigma factor regulator N-terminal domain-containing protein [Mobilisporobacter senegalensis]ROR29233.1 sigma factor regulator [Mobilisporobacter senegalensis]
MTDFDEFETKLKDISDLDLDEKDMVKQLEKQINRRIRNICLKTIGVLLFLAGFLYLVINPIMNYGYLNPQKLENNDKGFTKYLRAYFETMRPYAEVVSVEIDKQGFGKYTVNLDMQNHIGKTMIGLPNVTMEIDKGKASVITDVKSMTTALIGRFESNWVKKDEFLKDLEELPDSSVVYLSIGVNTPIPLSELRKEDIQLDWIEFYNNVSQYQGGLSLNLCTLYEDTDERKKLSDKELKEIFLQNLDLLMTQPVLFQSLGIYSGSLQFFTLDEIKKTRESIDSQEELTIKNYCFSGKKQEVIEYLKKTDVYSIHVDDIQLTIW